MLRLSPWELLCYARRHQLPAVPRRDVCLGWWDCRVHAVPKQHMDAAARGHPAQPVHASGQQQSPSFNTT